MSGRQLSIDGIQDVHEPLTPAYCDLTDYPYMPLDVQQFLTSDFTAEVDPEAGFFAIQAWAASWHEVPAASLPGSDKAIAKLVGLGRDITTFNRLKDGILYGWVQCSDGRWYHPVIAKKALESFVPKMVQRIKSGMAIAKRWNNEFDYRELSLQLGYAFELLKKSSPSNKIVINGIPKEYLPESSGIDEEYIRNTTGIPEEYQVKVSLSISKDITPPLSPPGDSGEDKPPEQPPKAPAKQSPKKAEATKLNPDWLEGEEPQNTFREIMRAEGVASTVGRWKLVKGDFLDHWHNTGSNATKYKKTDWLKTWENHVRRQINYNKLKWKAEDSKSKTHSNGEPGEAWGDGGNWIDGVDFSRYGENDR